MSVYQLHSVSGRFLHIMNCYLGSVLHSTYHSILAPFMGFWRRNIMLIEIIVINIIGRMKGCPWKPQEQYSKKRFIHHNSVSETRLSPENCLLILSEKVGISPFFLFGTIPTTVGWIWFFVLHSCPWDFIWRYFGWGDMCLHTYEWQRSQSPWLICHRSLMSCDVWHPWQHLLHVSQEWQQDLVEFQRTEVLWNCHSISQPLDFLCLSLCLCQQLLLSQSIKDLTKIIAESSSSSMYRTPSNWPSI